MKIHKVTEGFKKLMGKGRLFVAGATASVVPMVYSAGAAYAQTPTISDLGTDAKAELGKLVGQIIPIGVVIIGVAVAIAGVAVILRLTKKS